MKRDKIIYWIATSIVGLGMTMSGIMYFSNPEVEKGFEHLGFPGYFRIELGIAKLLGVLILVIPSIPFRLKEWAYAGFGITFISAFIAHISSGDPGSLVAGPLIFLVVLLVSRFYLSKTRSEKLNAAT